MIHYHIRWSNSELDWEPFCTREEAEVSALDLVLLDESYIIQEFDETCSECSALKSQIEGRKSVGVRRKLRWLKHTWETAS
jgi:hypothetical protein